MFDRLCRHHRADMLQALEIHLFPRGRKPGAKDSLKTGFLRTPIGIGWFGMWLDEMDATLRARLDPSHPRFDPTIKDGNVLS